jgi:HK97 family phage portal protein
MSSFNDFAKKYAVQKGWDNLDPDFFKYNKTNGLNTDPKESYILNSWVYAACQAIVRNIVSIPKALDYAKTEERELLIDHAIMDLLANPNSMMDRDSFLETIILNLLLPTQTSNGGQCFLIFNTGSTGKKFSIAKGDMPIEIYPFSDQYVQPILNDNKILTGWVLTVNDKKINFGLDEVIRIHLTDPKNPLKGLSPLVSIYGALREDLKASQVNEAFFDNNASLGGVLTTDAKLSTDQVREIKEQWEAMYGGSNNAGKDAVLHSGLHYQQFQRTHAEMMFIDQKKWTRDQVLAVLGVPKAEVASYEDVNYSNAVVSNKAFWEKTLLPLDTKIVRALNTWIKNIDNGIYRLVSDLSKVQALQENLTEKLVQAKELFQMQVPLAVINERLGLNLNLTSVPWANTSFISYGLAPAEQVMYIEPMQTEATNSQTQTVENNEKEDAEEVEDNTKKSVSTKAQKAQLRARYADSYYKEVLKPSEKRFRAMADKFFVQQRNKVLDSIDDWRKNNKALARALPTENTFSLDLKEQTDILRRLMLPEYKTSVKKEAQRMKEELGELITWDEQSPLITQAMKERLKYLRNINKTSNKLLSNKIIATVKQGTEENLTVTELAELLKKEVRVLYNNPWRATTIARTESGIIHAKARADIIDKEGIEMVEWISSRDDQVRSSTGGAEFPHDILDGVVINRAKGETFNNGENLEYPKDTSASAGNIINCRCILRAIPPNDKEKN